MLEPALLTPDVLSETVRSLQKETRSFCWPVLKRLSVISGKWRRGRDEEGDPLGSSRRAYRRAER
jgi:hypothetical protein